MKYEQKQTATGAWVNKALLENGSTARIVSETKPILSNFQDKDGKPQNQDVAKVQFKDAPEPLNVALNRATIAGLIDAFGDDSVNWQGHDLTVETEKTRVAGKIGISLYLIPNGYKKTDDENGYAVIVKKVMVGQTGVEYPGNPATPAF